jgi:hypothetical protein
MKKESKKEPPGFVSGGSGGENSTSRLLKKVQECFEDLSMNGKKSSTILNPLRSS